MYDSTKYIIKTIIQNRTEIILNKINVNHIKILNLKTANKIHQIIDHISIFLIYKNTSQNHLRLQRSSQQFDTLLERRRKNSTQVRSLELKFK